MATLERLAAADKDRGESVFFASGDDLHQVQALQAFLGSVDRTALFLAARRGDRVQTAELAAPIYRALWLLARELSRGNAVSLVSSATILTTTQAARLLNVSRPHLVKLVRSREIPFHQVGNHHRLALADVLAYRESRDNEFRLGMQRQVDMTRARHGLDLTENDRDVTPDEEFLSTS